MVRVMVVRVMMDRVRVTGTATGTDSVAVLIRVSVTSAMHCGQMTVYIQVRVP